MSDEKDQDGEEELEEEKQITEAPKTKFLFDNQIQLAKEAKYIANNFDNLILTTTKIQVNLHTTSLFQDTTI